MAYLRTEFFVTGLGGEFLVVTVLDGRITLLWLFNTKRWASNTSTSKISSVEAFNTE